MDLDQAMELAELHHSGQVDKAGQPYIGHIRRVVGAVDTFTGSLLRSTISWRTRP
jgi:(p)ppGpp synthase/HD superfamily hydrolase